MLLYNGFIAPTVSNTTNASNASGTDNITLLASGCHSPTLDHGAARKARSGGGRILTVVLELIAVYIAYYYRGQHRILLTFLSLARFNLLLDGVILLQPGNLIGMIEGQYRHWCPYTMSCHG